MPGRGRSGSWVGVEGRGGGGDAYGWVLTIGLLNRESGTGVIENLSETFR